MSISFKKKVVKFLTMICICIMILQFTACSNLPSGSNNDEIIDLTVLSSTMVYSQVSDMVNNPSHYNGKIVKANGIFSIYREYNSVYYAVVIQDATACCSQGLEFVLADGNYPTEGSNIVVQGTFGTYRENGIVYCQLRNARLV